MNTLVAIPYERIADFCERNGIRKLSIYGSALRSDFNQSSDIDLLVEFDPNARVTLLSIAGMELELSRIFNRKVDLRTSEDLSVYFRDDVVRTAEVVYVL